MINDDFVIEAKSEVNFVEEKRGDPCSSDGFIGGA